VTYLLDARTLQDHSASRGIGTYTRGLLEGFHAIGINRDVELLLGPGTPPPEVVAYDVRMSRRRVPVTRRRLQPLLDPLLTSAVLVEARPALYHGLDFGQPLYARTPVVVTVHDLIPFVLPSMYPFLRRQRSFALRLLRFADALVVDSESTARDVVHYARIDPERIHRVPLGVSPRFGADPDVDLEHTLARLGVRQPFLLAVGVFDERKRIQHVVKIAADVRRHHDVQLVIVGEQGYFDAAVRTAVDAAGMHPHTSILGFVDTEDLIALYRRTACLLFTSAYEGFGLPPLEAMAAGAPVAMYANSSLPEVAGDAAIMVADGDRASLARKVVELLGDPAEMEARREHGRRRAGRYTWTRTATEMLAVYEGVLGRERRAVPALSPP
jgi:glycosyltransferase involved in cell wall biosynthesis